jgi:hypothetical protein
MVGRPPGRYTEYMWRRRLSLGGFVIGAALAACLLNCPPEHSGFFCRFGANAATPLLIVLSPIVFLLSAVGLKVGPVAALAGSSVLTWTAVGFATSLWAGSKRR